MPEEKSKAKSAGQEHPWWKRRRFFSLLLLAIAGGILFPAYWKLSPFSLEGKCKGAFEKVAADTLSDPLSLKIYKVEALPVKHFDDPEIKDPPSFRIDYGAKNGFGGMTRDSSICTTLRNEVVAIDDNSVQHSDPAMNDPD